MGVKPNNPTNEITVLRQFLCRTFPISYLDSSLIYKDKIRLKKPRNALEPLLGEQNLKSILYIPSDAISDKCQDQSVTLEGQSVTSETTEDFSKC